MRDNHEGYPEIIDAYERDGQYFGAVRLDLADGKPSLEFGVSASGYYALKRILGTRPFDSLPGLAYRYFFTGSFTGSTKPDQETFEFAIRVEQGTTAKTLQLTGPKALLANLLWFAELKTIEQTSGLRRLDKPYEPFAQP
jgi:hypothetical protein